MNQLRTPLSIAKPMRNVAAVVALLMLLLLLLLRGTSVGDTA